MDLRTPFKHIKDNLLLTKDGEVFAYYKIKSKSISTGNHEKKDSYKKDIKGFLDQLIPYQDIHISMFPVDMDLDNRFKQIEEDFDKKLYDVGKYYADETVSLLKQELGMITLNDFLVGIKLRELDIDDVSVSGYIKNTVFDFSDKLFSSFGLEADFDDKVLERYKVLEKELYSIMGNIDADRISEEQLKYFNRLSYISSSNHDVVKESSKSTITEISNTVFDPYYSGLLKVNNDYEEYYQTHLVIDEFPYDMKYTHIFEKLQNLNFPLKVDIKAQFQSKEGLKKKMDRAKTNLGQQTSERLNTGDSEEEDVIDSLYVMKEMEKEVKHNDNFMSWIAIVTIKDTDKKELKNKANKVINKLEHNNITVVRPLADQINLLYQTLPAQKLILNKYWNQQTNTDGLAETMFGISQKLGTNTGFYLGRIDKFSDRVDRDLAVASSRDIVLFNMLVAAQGVKGAQSASPHVMITGETGKGKSFLAKLLFIYTALFECKIIYFDPKSEMYEWFNQVVTDEYFKEHYPLFVKLLNEINYITLDYTDSDNIGCLDPIVYLDYESSIVTLKDIIYSLRNINDVPFENALNSAMKEVAERRNQGEKVGTLHVFKKLQEHESKAVRDYGELFIGMAESSLLKLIFSDGSNDALNVKGKMSILQIKGLDLPDVADSSNEYKENQKASMAVFLTIGKFLEEFNNNRKEHTVTFIDEGWVFTRSSAGKRQKKQLTKTGRSLLNTLVFISQSVADGQDDDDNGNFGSHFAFDMPTERKEILDSMGLEHSENEKENLELLDNLSIGQCLFKDFYGRTGTLTVDCLFEEMTKAFKTLDKTKSAHAEEKFA